MASLYKRFNSPFWWIKYRNPTGAIIRESTNLRHAFPNDTKKARELCAEKSLEEVKIGGTTDRGRWISWVPHFLEERYHDSEKTYIAQSNRWASLQRYFTEQGIVHPRQISFDHCFEYLKWRTRKKEPGFHKATRNTAIYELKTLSLIMKHAVKRGFIAVNPCTSLGIKKDKPKEKPEMTDTDIARIRAELVRIENGRRTWPEWMQISFEIAIHQGCRLRETSLLFDDIDFNKEVITFNAKGNKRFTTKLHPDLVPFLRNLKKDGRKRTCEMPDLPSKWFWMLFKKLKRKDLCFHCTRVTVITRLARQGVPISQAMKFVGHASETIHHVYQRLSVDDLGPCLNALKYNLPQQNLDGLSSK